MKNIAYQSLKNYLNKNDLHYTEDQEDNKAIYISFDTKDFPIQNRIVITESPNTLVLYSYFTFEVEEEKRLEAAMGVAMVNYALSAGCFDFDVTNGKMVFRIQTCYSQDGRIEDDFISYLIINANHIVDYFNDKLFFLVSGKTSLDDFYQQVKNFS